MAEILTISSRSLRKVKSHAPALTYSPDFPLELSFFRPEGSPAGNTRLRVRAEGATEALYEWTDGGHVPEITLDVPPNPGYRDVGIIIVEWFNPDNGTWVLCHAYEDKILGRPRARIQKAALEEQLDNARQEAANARESLASALDDLHATESELQGVAKELEAAQAELATLAERKPDSYWMDAVARGLPATDAYNRGFKNCGQISCFYGWTETLEDAAGIDGPWVAPEINVPATAATPPSAAFLFVNCKNLLYAPCINTPHGDTNAEQICYGCEMLTRAPRIDTSCATSFKEAFYKSGIKDWPEWDFSKGEKFDNMFRSCQGMEHARAVSLPAAKSFREVFSNASELKSVGTVEASHIEDFSGFLWRAQKVQRVEQLDFGRAMVIGNYGPSDGNESYNVGGYGEAAYPYNELRFLKIINLGKSDLPRYRFTSFPAWGSGPAENRQSLIDTLITHSYDRAAAGMPTATIHLHAMTKRLLTASEMAAITAKGFTIV